MSQMDELDRMLEQSGQSVEEKRARTARGPLVSRRALLMGLGGLAGAGVLGGVGVGVARVVAAKDDVMEGVPAVADPASRTADVAALPEGVKGTVVWSGETTGIAPVLAVRGTGAVVDSEGHVQIVGDGKLLATSTDITPDAVLVAGDVAGVDMIAWTTGRNLSWWTAAHGIQRAQHARPLGLTAVAGGILVFDDDAWSGRLGATEVSEIPTASDSITIGLRPDGASVAATSDGILTLTPADGQMQIVQPEAPAADAQVWQVAGIVGEFAVLVWAVAAHPELPCAITTLSVDSGATVGSGSAERAAVDDAEVIRCATGAAFGGLLVGPDGAIRPIPEGVSITGGAGDLLAATGPAGPVTVDPATGDVQGETLWALHGQKSTWIKDKSAVWFVDNDKEKS